MSRNQNNLAELWDECRIPDWDGHQALPIQWETYLLAGQFLQSLPLKTPSPSLGADPDGDITLEWSRGPRRTLSVSISPDATLHYAALLGASRISGSTPYYDEIPALLLNLIEQVR